MEEKTKLENNNITKDIFAKVTKFNSDPKALDLDFYDRCDLNIDWTKVTFECDEEEELPESPKRRHTSNKAERYKVCNNPKFFLVKIRISNGRTYQVAKVQIENIESLDKEETELINHYYKKLNKRHFHIQKPRHRVFRTSIIDELYIDLSDS